MSNGGLINIVSEDGDLQYVFEVPEDHKEVLAGEARWNNPEADIVGDIQRWKQKLRDDGYDVPKRMIMTYKIFSYLMKNKAIKLDIDKDGRVVLKDTMMKNYIKNKLEISIAMVSGTYKLEDGTTDQYFPDDKVTLIPGGSLGSTYYGTIPEEADKDLGKQLKV